MLAVTEQKFFILRSFNVISIPENIVIESNCKHGKKLIPCSPSDWFKVCITSIENLVHHLSCHLRCASQSLARCKFPLRYLFLNKLGFDQSFHRYTPNTIPMLLLNAKGGVRSWQVGHKLTVCQIRFPHLESRFSIIDFWGSIISRTSLQARWCTLLKSYLKIIEVKLFVFVKISMPSFTYSAFDNETYLFTQVSNIWMRFLTRAPWTAPLLVALLQQTNTLGYALLYNRWARIGREE